MPVATNRPVRASVLVMLLTAGCAAEVSDAESGAEVGLDSEAIFKGSSVDTGTDQRGGFVALSILQGGTDNVFCSGTLYLNNYFLTARHCFRDAQVVKDLQKNPSALRVTMGRGESGTQLRAGKTIYFPNRDIDYAIVEVNFGFIMPRNSDGVLDTIGYQRPITSVASGALLTCFGYGLTSQNCDTNGNCSSVGKGTLRYAALITQIQRNSPPVDFYKFDPNSAGQLPAGGDSGGGCVTTAGAIANMWKQPLVGILEQCSPQPGGHCTANMATEATHETWHVANDP